MGNVVNYSVKRGGKYVGSNKAMLTQFYKMKYNIHFRYARNKQIIRLYDVRFC